MTRGIVLCADDYGQAPAISDGILALVIKKRLSAVSCLVNAPFWAEAAAALMEVGTTVDIGLHFNLTQGNALSKVYRNTYGDTFLSLSSLMRKAFLRQLDQQVIVKELEAQLDAFQAATGQLPRFIDGHQHIHQFPVIRDAFLAVYKSRDLVRSEVYVRLSRPRLASFKHLKRLIIVLSGAITFERQLRRDSIPYNTTFSGSYSFADLGQYRDHFQSFLQEVGDNGLIMCHPALRSESPEDPIAKARFEEYCYLASDQFLEDCHANRIKIGQFKTSVAV